MTKLFITLYAIQFACNMFCWRVLFHKHKDAAICDTCTRLLKKDAYGYYYCALQAHEISNSTQHPPEICHDYTNEPIRPNKEE